jgi:hypothetical protein
VFAPPVAAVLCGVGGGGRTRGAGGGNIAPPVAAAVLCGVGGGGRTRGAGEGNIGVVRVLGGTRW